MPPVSNETAALSAIEIDCLRLVAGRMIPASAPYDVPGADDPAIIADMVASVGRDGRDLKHILALVQEASESGSPASIGERDLIAALQRRDRARFAVLESLVLRTYYRDDRVLRSIGMEARPPFPKGYEVDEGDWSLLEPVRARGSVYRLPGA